METQRGKTAKEKDTQRENKKGVETENRENKDTESDKEKERDAEIEREKYKREKKGERAGPGHKCPLFWG